MYNNIRSVPAKSQCSCRRTGWISIDQQIVFMDPEEKFSIQSTVPRTVKPCHSASHLDLDQMGIPLIFCPEFFFLFLFQRQESWCSTVLLILVI